MTNTSIVLQGDNYDNYLGLLILRSHLQKYYLQIEHESVTMTSGHQALLFTIIGSLPTIFFTIGICISALSMFPFFKKSIDYNQTTKAIIMNTK